MLVVSIAGLKVMVASGPFTVAGDLIYHPLEELVSCIAKHRPSLVVLLGPFVDVEAGPVQDGTLDETFNTVFQREVRPETHGNVINGNAHFVMRAYKCLTSPSFPSPFRCPTMLMLPNDPVSLNYAVFSSCNSGYPRNICYGSGQRLRGHVAWPSHRSTRPKRVKV